MAPELSGLAKNDKRYSNRQLNPTRRDSMTKYVAKWPDSNGFIEFTETEDSTWNRLYERQIKTIQNRACDEFIDGLDELGLTAERIPQIPDVNKALKKTGWSMVPVSGTVDVNEFFKMLTRREFPVANFIRIPEELDYLKQPDLFHEFFGHGPLLMNHAYADFVQWYGQTAQQLTLKQQRIFSRLFWFTIEFGLLQTDKGLRVLGGGILSSHAETQFSLESDQPRRLEFSVKEILSTPYDYQNIQEAYFILPDLSSLYALHDDRELISFLGDVAGDQKSFVVC